MTLPGTADRPMRAARELAGGDSGRIIVQRDGSVLVANRPRLSWAAPRR